MAEDWLQRTECNPGNSWFPLKRRNCRVKRQWKRQLRERERWFLCVWLSSLLPEYGYGNQIHREGKVRAAPPPTNLTALRGGFAATGAPLVGQIVYPTFPLIHTCICMYGQKYTCQQICSSSNLFFCLQTETILVQTFSQFQKTISWISGAFILLHGQNNTFNNGILSCRKSSGVFFDIFWHFID